MNWNMASIIYCFISCCYSSTVTHELLGCHSVSGEHVSFLLPRLFEMRLVLCVFCFWYELATRHHVHRVHHKCHMFWIQPDCHHEFFFLLYTVAVLVYDFLWHHLQEGSMYGIEWTRIEKAVCLVWTDRWRRETGDRQLVAIMFRLRPLPPS